jgi:hypothetical protein
VILIKPRYNLSVASGKSSESSSQVSSSSERERRCKKHTSKSKASTHNAIPSWKDELISSDLQADSSSLSASVVKLQAEKATSPTPTPSKTSSAHHPVLANDHSSDSTPALTTFYTTSIGHKMMVEVSLAELFWR